MTLKQKNFADHYLISGNATESAIQAGYSKKTATGLGYKVLQQEVVKEYIKKERDKLDKKKIATREEVLQRLTAISRGEIKEEIVVVEGGGEGVSRAKKIEKEPPLKDIIKATELLGKIHGVFVDKVQVEANSVVQIVDDIDGKA